MVNSGMNAAIRMVAENRMARSTWIALTKKMRSLSVQAPLVVRLFGAVGSAPIAPCDRCSSRLMRALRGICRLRKMFSTMITAESMMMPKSTAPTDSRLASWCCSTSRMIANISANGMFSPTTMALRRSPRKIHWIRNTSRQPNTRLCSTVCVVTATSELRS